MCFEASLQWVRVVESPLRSRGWIAWVVRLWNLIAGGSYSAQPAGWTLWTPSTTRRLLQAQHDPRSQSLSVRSPNSEVSPPASSAVASGQLQLQIVRKDMGRCETPKRGFSEIVYHRPFEASRDTNYLGLEWDCHAKPATNLFLFTIFL